MTGGPSFSRLNNVTLRVCVCITPCLWSVRGHLGCFHVSAVVNNECTVIHIFCMYLLGSLILFPLDRYPVMELTGRMAVLSLLFEEPPCRFPPVYVPAHSAQGSIPHGLPGTFPRLFGDGLSDRCEVVFPWRRVTLSIFSFIHLLVICTSSLANV